MTSLMFVPSYITKSSSKYFFSFIKIIEGKNVNIEEIITSNKQILNKINLDIKYSY